MLHQAFEDVCCWISGRVYFDIDIRQADGTEHWSTPGYHGNIGHKWACMTHCNMPTWPCLNTACPWSDISNLRPLWVLFPFVLWKYLSSVNLNSTHLDTSIYCIRFLVSEKNLFPNVCSHGAKGHCFSTELAFYLLFHSMVTLWIRILFCILVLHSCITSGLLITDGSLLVTGKMCWVYMYPALIALYLSWFLYWKR